MTSGTTAIIGAGFSGLIAAHMLGGHQGGVRVFDKARGPGGRMATRRHGDDAFDHGAQYFTARHERFQHYVDRWVEAGLVQPWQGRIAVADGGAVTAKPDKTVRYVGVPRMSALTRHLSTGLDIQYNTRIEHLHRREGRWLLIDEAGTDQGTYDAVLVTTPPAQAAPLVAEAPSLLHQIETVTMAPCWAVMATFDEPLPLNFDGLFVHKTPVFWAARNNSKPGRKPVESWVLHASPSWSRENLESEQEAIVHPLISAFFEAVGLAPVAPRFAQAHRWRYALADNPLDVGCLWEDDLQLGVCGDWCMLSRVEGAFLSGMAGAKRVLKRTTASLS